MCQVVGEPDAPQRDRNQDGRFGIDEVFHFEGKFHKQNNLF